MSDPDTEKKHNLIGSSPTATLITDIYGVDKAKINFVDNPANHYGNARAFFTIDNAVAASGGAIAVLCIRGF